ncbi:MAG: carboxypeptidase-like regulatory domain-containing protein [Bacteroidota bacterium]
MRPFVLLFFLFIWINGFSQSLIPPSEQLADSSLEVFIAAREAGNKESYFYKSNWIKGLTIKGSSQSISLEKLLQQSLQESSLEVKVYKQAVFIYPKKPVPFSLEVSTQKQIRYSPDDQKNEPIIVSEPIKTTNRKLRLTTIGSDQGETGPFTIEGYIRTVEDAQAIVGASISFPNLKSGAITNENGLFTVQLPKGQHRSIIEAYGKDQQELVLDIQSDGEIEFFMVNEIRELDAVVIESGKTSNVQSTLMGVSRLNIQSIKQIPTILGEVDIIKTAILLPGVSSVGEGSSGFNVRGGTVDQNLIRLNEAPIYNPSHMFGFFSAFNPDMIDRFELYKSGIPAQYGGRLSSVMDIGMREGNLRKWVGSGGISPITLRFTAEGPLKKNRSSILIGGRTTYSDWLLNRLENEVLRNSEVRFSDINANLNLSLSKKDRLTVSLYASRDYFLLNADTSFTYFNTLGSINWKHIFNSRLFQSTSVVYSGYNYSIETRRNPETSFELDYQIQHYEFKSDWSYSPSSKHQIKFGMGSILYRLSPGNINPRGPNSLVQPLDIEQEQGLESAVYISEEYDLSPRIRLYGGLRWSFYQMLGSQTVYDYLEGAPLQAENIVDSTVFGNGQLVSQYAGPEFRFSSRFILNENASLKMGFHRMRQYLHVLSNTTSFAPTDTWKLTDPFIRPQISDQVSVGYFQNFLGNAMEGSIELYVKRVQNILDFKGGAQLVLNPYVETEILSGLGRGYGAEFYLRKKKGKLNGWISYTYSRIFTQITGEFPEETINRGEWFPATVDKPHDFSLVGTYQFSRRFSVSTNVAYSTGRPITYPVGKYQLGSSTLLSYSLRNQFRIPDYFRWDIAINLEGNHKLKKLVDSSWSLSVYNVLGRRNPFSIFFVSGTSGIQGYRLSIFGRPITTLTYNFKIK